jgi:hypothetical protein
MPHILNKERLVSRLEISEDVALKIPHFVPLGSTLQQVAEESLTIHFAADKFLESHGSCKLQELKMQNV